MRLLSFIWYDIKRLFGHGKTALLAVLAPIPVVLMFGLFLIPILSSGETVLINGGLCVEDDSLLFKSMMSMVVEYEEGQGNAKILSVETPEEGKRMVEDGEAALFLHVPKDTYQKAISGERAVMKFYYAKAHAFDALLFQNGIRSSVSVFGQGIRVIQAAGETAGAYGMNEEEYVKVQKEAVQELIGIYMHRGEIVGRYGIFLVGGAYHLRYAMALLFVACAFFASFPVMYMTSLDKNGIYAKRSIPADKKTKFFFARILSGAVLILCTFGVMYPVARMFKQLGLRSVLSAVPGILLTAFSFSALAVLIGSLFRRGQSALWTGLYFGAASFLGVTFLSDKAGVPAWVSFLMRISPLRASVSIFSNAMFNLMAERYVQDILVLSVSAAVFAAAGFFAYRKGGMQHE
ncbi:MAG: ABC transporter permease [Lachnospiraceae bacterium]|nr:ABC transporter permease [Lachnospiraceae bacterium]